MAKVIKGEKQYALILNQQELDFITAITQRISPPNSGAGTTPDWGVYRAVANHSNMNFSSLFVDDGSNRYPKWRDDWNAVCRK